MFPHPVAAGVALVQLEPRHAAELYGVVDANREHLRRWLPWVDASTTPEFTLAFIRRTLQQAAENNGWNFAITVDGQIAGAIGQHWIDWGNRRTSLGYWLAAGHQGRGVMTAAVRAITTHAFTELGLNRMEIRCATGNTRSCAIPQRLGFAREGVVREAEWLYDHFVDHAVYGMLAREWVAAR